ncbi:MAG: hypothetical protein ABIS01_13785 [Ferruginibacter sp.]
MPAQMHITANALISRSRILKNGQPVFEDKMVDAPAFLTAVYQHFGLKYPKFYKMDNLSKLGWLASAILLKDSFEPGKYKPEEVGVILFNASSSLDADLRYFESAKEFASPALFVYTLPNIVIGEICIHNHFKGENAFFISEAFDADFVQKYVSNLINNNILQACICGWVEFIEEAYEAVLFLVEKSGDEQKYDGAYNIDNTLFTKDNLNKIYQSNNG